MSADYQPWYVGQTIDPIIIPLFKGSVADDITNIAIGKFSMVFRSLNNVDTPGTGTFSLVTASPAVVSYKFSPGDVAAAFSGNLFVKALGQPSGTTADQAVWDPIPFVVTQS